MCWQYPKFTVLSWFFGTSLNNHGQMTFWFLKRRQQVLQNRFISCEIVVEVFVLSNATSFSPNIFLLIVASTFSFLQTIALLSKVPLAYLDVVLHTSDIGFCDDIAIRTYQQFWEFLGPSDCVLTSTVPLNSLHAMTFWTVEMSRAFLCVEDINRFIFITSFSWWKEHMFVQ